MQTITEPVTIGNRYTRIIKGYMANLIKHKDDLRRLEESKVINLNALAIKKISAFFSIPQKSIHIVNPDKYMPYGEDRVVLFTYKGQKFSASQPFIFTDIQLNKYKKDIAKCSDIKSNFCKEHVLMIEALRSPMINKFKAFATARYETKTKANSLSDHKFKALVLEFLETQRSHSCPL